jgi:hypothetical protein
MNKHKHAELMMQYAQDAMTTDTPWELWECRVPRSLDPRWANFYTDPEWSSSINYRRKPKQHTITLSTDQLDEIIMACSRSHVGWENEDFVGGYDALRNAQGGVK